MIHFEGDKELPLSPGELWAKLSDCRFLSQCVPGAVSVPEVDVDHAVCILKPGFSFVRSTLEITLKQLEAVPQSVLRYQVSSKGIGSSSQTITSLTLLPRDAATQVHWSADIVELGGLLKAIPPGLIQASAERVILDTWTYVEARLAATP